MNAFESGGNPSLNSAFSLTPFMIKAGGIYILSALLHAVMDIFSPLSLEVIRGHLSLPLLSASFLVSSMLEVR